GASRQPRFYPSACDEDRGGASGFPGVHGSGHRSRAERDRRRARGKSQGISAGIAYREGARRAFHTRSGGAPERARHHLQRLTTRPACAGNGVSMTKTIYLGLVSSLNEAICSQLAKHAGRKNVMECAMHTGRVSEILDVDALAAAAEVEPAFAAGSRE